MSVFNFDSTWLKLQQRLFLIDLIGNQSKNEVKSFVVVEIFKYTYYTYGFESVRTISTHIESTVISAKICTSRTKCDPFVFSLFEYEGLV